MNMSGCTSTKGFSHNSLAEEFVEDAGRTGRMK